MTKPTLNSIFNFCVTLIIFIIVFIFILLPFAFALKAAFVENGSINFYSFYDVCKNNFELLKNSFAVATLTTTLTAVASVSTALFFFTASKKLQVIIIAVLYV